MNKQDRIQFLCEVALPLCYVAASVVIVAMWGRILVMLTETL